MARFFANVNATIVLPTTSLSAVKQANPGMTIFFVRPFVARHGFFDLSTVTFHLEFDRTSTTNALVTRSLAGVLAARHDITTDLTTTPSGFVVSIEASSRGGLLAAKAALYRTYACTWWTRPGMAELVARMWACFWKRSVSATSLTTRMWRQAADELRIHLFFAPAGIIRGQCLFGQVAARASPLFASVIISVLLCRSVDSRSFVLSPLLDTTYVKHSPTCMARPYFCFSADFV